MTLWLIIVASVFCAFGYCLGAVMSASKRPDVATYARERGYELIKIRGEHAQLVVDAERLANLEQVANASRLWMGNDIGVNGASHFTKLRIAIHKLDDRGNG